MTLSFAPVSGRAEVERLVQGLEGHEVRVDEVDDLVLVLLGGRLAVGHAVLPRGDDGNILVGRHGETAWQGKEKEDSRVCPFSGLDFSLFAISFLSFLRIIIGNGVSITTSWQVRKTTYGQWKRDLEGG